MDYKDAIIIELKKQNEEFRKEIVFLKKEIEELKELLRLNSKNSSKLPSIDRNKPQKELPQWFGVKFLLEQRAIEVKDL